MPILGSLGCEWLLCLTIFHTCSWCLFLTLQFVSGYFALQYFMPAHDAYSWLSRMWVATLPCNILCLLMMHVLGSPGSEWLLCLTIFSCLLMMLVLDSQNVSGYFALQYFMPAHDACTWLSRMWVATLPCNISCLLMMLVLGSPGSECLAIFHAWLWCLYLALQVVSGYFASPCFMPAHDTCSWLSRKSVTAVPCHVLCLLMMPVLDFPGSQWLLYLAIFYGCSSCLFLAL